MPRRKSRAAVKQKPERKKLNWQEFNFIENLLAFCSIEDGCAPPDSGVEFRINSPTSDDLLCILFEIDRGGNDPLVRDGIKPDYMVLYVDDKVCVCTIIEMKGRDEDDLEHGIDQIKRLRDILREQLREHLPNRLRTTIKFQGILLSPPNANVPLPKIKKEESNGLVILALQYHQKAELFNYICKVHKDVNVRYKHEPAPHSVGHGFIENVMIENVLEHRIKDKFFTTHYKSGRDRRGIYLNYKLSKGEYIALVLNNSSVRVGVREGGNVILNRIARELNKLGVKNQNAMRLENIK